MLSVMGTYSVFIIVVVGVASMIGLLRYPAGAYIWLLASARSVT